ncbi:MAG: HflK protein [Deltaproteobacteria bacterium RIFOXYD12_FULL_57_12]|nr:MAG: HflK protein [Deltaproteobacteria bacterium RIFOXYD12_FULL_57_12]
MPPGAGDQGSSGQSGPFGSKPRRGGLLLLVVGVIILFQLITSTFYTIEPGEQGVVLRFGRFSKTAPSGLNFKVPLIDQVIKVDVETVRKEEFGFRTKTPARQTVYEKEGFDAESLMLTADKNVIDVEWIVQYKVRDPFDFLFKVGDVSQAVRDLSETAIRRIVGNMDFDYVLSNREILAASTAKELQAALDIYESGIDIVTVQLQDVNPPNTVKPAFNEVNEADQDMKRLVNEAEEAYNQVVPKAHGQAKELLEQSHGYAKERVNIAKGEAGRFLAVLKEYRAAKEVTRQRLYLETMQEVLPTLTDIYVIDKDQRGLLPFLNLTGGSTPVAPQP